MTEDLIEKIRIGDYLLDSSGMLPAEADNNIFRIVDINTAYLGDFFKKADKHSVLYRLAYLYAGAIKIIDRVHVDSFAGTEMISFTKVKEILVESNKNKFQGLEVYADILRRVFPGNVVTAQGADGHIYSWILTKETTVSNNSGLSTIIRDTVLRFKYAKKPDGEFVLADLKGQGFTATPDQVRAGYAHSHIQSSGLREWSSCCLGGTDLSKTFTKLKLGLSEVNFEMVLYQLKDYLKHESTKGGPFVRISSIGSVSSLDNNIDLDALEQCFYRLVSNKAPLKLNVSTSKGTIKCGFDRDSLSEHLLRTGLVPSEHEGKMSDGQFISNARSTNQNLTTRFLGSPGLCVNDDHCSIDLTKKLFENRENIDVMGNVSKYVSPRFMNVFEDTYRNQFEAFIINKIVNKNERKEKTKEHKVDIEQGAFSYGELPT
jgi:hypothetical protein